MATAGTGRIGNFARSILERGLSYNNEYSFYFEPSTEESKDGVANYLYQGGFQDAFGEDQVILGSNIQPAGFKLKVLCEEISLPGVSTATGQARGIYQGVDFKYAHTKIYNDLSVSFLCDRDYTALRFFEQWFHYAYQGSSNNEFNFDRTYTTRLYYEYCMNMTIVKNEDKNGEPLPNNTLKKSAEYALINVFPNSISSIPLNTGASQVVRFTVNLSYERWTMRVNDSQSNNFPNSKILSLGKQTP